MTQTAPDPSSAPAVEQARPPFLHRVIMAGQLRYWIIASWALALLTTAPWPIVAAWFVVTLAFGVFRTLGERRAATLASRWPHLPLAIATVSCIAWAAAPLLSFYLGHAHGLAMAVVLLMAGYVLVFTQMRAAPREALIVSAPYTCVVAILTVALWGDQGSWTVLAMMPVLGLALLIKVVITEIKDAQLAEVNGRQGELIEDLAAARDRANAASDAKTKFLAVISHELRTPMNGVLGAAQLLETTALSDTQDTYVSIIRRSGESLLMQLNDILDLTKIEAGRLELDLACTDFDDLLNRMVGPFEAQAEAKGLTFTRVGSGTSPSTVRVDALRMAQISHNLLSNAVKFTDVGGVVVTVVCEPLADGRACMRLSVSDSGAGISADDLERLFQPFSQVDASSTRRFGGTGLGLSICRRLAQLMEGDVTVSSEPGAGSTFTLELELEVIDWEAAGPMPDLAGVDEPAPIALRVLIVEDHPVNRIVLEAWLRAVGHECASAENGQLALDMLADQAFDLIIMDVNMPVMDGLTATRHLRANGGPNRDVPVAVLSASARPEDHILGLTAGADAYVDKPVDFATLALVVAAAPRGREAVRLASPLPAAA